MKHVVTKIAMSGFLALTLFVVAPIHATNNPLTAIEADNNGMSLLVTTDSDHDILAINIRIVGPDEFVFEDRIEADSYEWVPPTNLPDGRYNWEAWVVTARPGAVYVEPPGLSPAHGATEFPHVSFDGGQVTAVQPSETESVDLSEVPIERFYRAEDKNVESTHGRFEMRNGNMSEMIEALEPHSAIEQPGRIQRIAGRVLDWLIPSAHAQTGEFSQVTLDSNIASGPAVLWRTDSSSTWVARGNDERWRLFDFQTNQKPFYIETGARRNSIYVRGTFSGERAAPAVGIGTTTPVDVFHLSNSSGPRLRLEETGAGESWWVGNNNQSRFSIEAGKNYSCDIPGGSCTSNAFQIELPSTNLQAQRQDQAIYITANGRIGFGGEPTLGGNAGGAHFRGTVVSDGGLFALGNGLGVGTSQTEYVLRATDDDTFGDVVFSAQHGNSVPFLVSKKAGDAALVIAEGGDIGVGTGEPATGIHLKREGRAGIVLDAGPGEQADFSLRQDGIDRFVFRVRSDNTNFEIARRNASGGFLDSPMRIAHSTGIVQIQNGLNVFTNNTPPTPGSGATLFVDSSGNLRVRFANGTIRTIASD